MTAYRNGTLGSFLPQQMSKCDAQVTRLLNVYEDQYGQDSATAFLKGPYVADLERAVLSRIRPELDDKVSQIVAQERADKAAADARAAEEVRQEAQAEAERQTRLAEAQQQAAAAKAAAAQAEADAKAIAAKAEAERLQRVDVAKRAEGLLVEKVGTCARGQLGALVKSGESAEVLASAVMTICAPDVRQELDGGVDEFKLEHPAPSGEFSEEIVREKIRADTREQIVALAVQAKAGVGAFAPAAQ